MAATVLRILQNDDYGSQVARGADALNQGKLIVLPTETSYGVAGLIGHAAARAALAELRGPAKGPMTLHLARPRDAQPLLGQTNELGRRMMRKLWPGPVGLVFDVPAETRAAAAAALGVEQADLYLGSSITLRCPDHPVFYDVVSQANGLAALTLAGEPQRRVQDLPGEVFDRAELIYDTGESRFNKPSTLVKLTGDQYQIVRHGVYDGRIIERLLKTTILFVCSGNTCRSPMAEAIARQVLAEQLKVPPEELEKRGINVMSAGAFAVPGAKATPQAVEVGQSKGFDLTRHRSRPLTVELIHQADVIFTMSRGQAQVAAAIVPAAADKVSTLDPDGDIEDPIGGDVSLYAEVADQLRTLIERRIKEMGLADRAAEEGTKARRHEGT